MKILITDDDFTSRILLQRFLSPYGEVHVAVCGKEALEAVQTAIDNGEPYSLICLDIMMPEMDGQATLQQIRKMEEDKGCDLSGRSKIIMTTALNDMKNVCHAFEGLCDAYLVKPIEKSKLLQTLQDLGL